MEEAATIFQNVLRNECTQAQFDVVSSNAGLAIHCIKPEQSLEDCIAEAGESLKSRKALTVLEKLLSSQ